MAQSRAPGPPGPPSVLLTRPQAGSMRFAGMLKHRFGADLPIVISPLMALSFLRPDRPAGAFRAVIFTSEAGVAAAVDERLPPLPRRALCVGDATADAARAAGFDARSAGGDASALIALAKGAGLRGPLLHLRGVHATGEIAAHLTAAGIETVEQIVYRQSPQHLNAEALALLQGQGPVILPLFSPRSAALVADELALNAASAHLYIAAISPAVAVESRRLQAVRTCVAAEPHAVSMVQAIADLMTGHRTA